jgi:hypothetical protein
MKLSFFLPLALMAVSAVADDDHHHHHRGLRSQHHRHGRNGGGHHHEAREYDDWDARDYGVFEGRPVSEDTSTGCYGMPRSFSDLELAIRAAKILEVKLGGSGTLATKIQKIEDPNLKNAADDVRKIRNKLAHVSGVDTFADIDSNAKTEFLSGCRMVTEIVP